MKISTLTTTTLAISATSLQYCSGFIASRVMTPSSSSAPSCLSASTTSDDDNHDSSNMNSRRQLILAAGLVGMATTIPSMASAAADTALDFSLPSYDPKMKGFAEGSEASTSKLESQKAGLSTDTTYTDPGADEKAKQLRSMQLAEEARKAAVEAKNAKLKAIAEEEKRRSLEKKAKNAERFASIFN